MPLCVCNNFVLWEASQRRREPSKTLKHNEIQRHIVCTDTFVLAFKTYIVTLSLTPATCSMSDVF